MSSKSAESFGFLTQALWAVAAVDAASEIGVLQRLDTGTVTSDDLSSDLGIDTDRCRLLLTALAGLGLAERDGAIFRPAVPGVGEVAARLLHNGRLSEGLSGETPALSAETTAGSARLYPTMVRYLAWGFQEAAAKAAMSLAHPGTRILDLGAGAAPWSLAVIARSPDARVIAVDLPEVISATEAAVDEFGFADRFEVRGGDLFEVDLERDCYDLVIAGGVCHLFDEPTNTKLMGLAHRALAPGGTLAILEPLIDEDLDGPRSVVLYALDLGTRTRGGGVRPFSDYVAWLTSAGLKDIDRTDLSACPPMSLITAHKPTETEVL